MVTAAKAISASSRLRTIFPRSTHIYQHWLAASIQKTIFSFGIHRTRSWNRPLKRKNPAGELQAGSQLKAHDLTRGRNRVFILPIGRFKFDARFVSV